MYQRLPSWVLGFHGTDHSTVQRLVKNPKEVFDPSNNDYDWLGPGVYFWENDPVRAMLFAKEGMQRKNIRKKPAVIGAVIDLGLCLNLFDQPALSELTTAYDEMRLDFDLFGVDLPVNHGGEDRLRRFLDCAVINHVHRLRSGSPLTPPYQTVRSGFHEGKELYSGAGFKQKNHIQIAVRDHSCIKGLFLPREQHFSGATAAAG